MSVGEIIKKALAEEGRSQVWIIDRMNEIDQNLKMDRTKFSSIVTDHRKLSADEMLAFCKALEISPDIFVEQSSL